MSDLGASTAWALTRIEQACCSHPCVHPAAGPTAVCCRCGYVWTREAFLTYRFRRVVLFDDQP